jgi:hypothetical protein
MVTVLFHLVMLGLITLVTSIGLSPDAGIRSVLARVGVMLVLTAVGHGVTMGVLSRLRQQQLATQLAETQIAETHIHQQGHGAGQFGGERPGGPTDIPRAQRDIPPADKPAV